MKKPSVFASEEEFQGVYDAFLEKGWPADTLVGDAYEKMDNAIENYISAVEEDMFRYAYEYGYKAAMEKMQKGGAV